MIYSENEILQYIDENDVKFVKLTFCDLQGRLKNISILSSELAVTFERGVGITARKLSGFEAAKGKDLYLFPDAQTMTVLPWRPQQGRVIRMFCYIRYADGTPFEGDGRYFLKKAMKAAVAAGYCFRFGTSRRKRRRSLLRRQRRHRARRRSFQNPQGIRHVYPIIQSLLP